MAESAEQSFVSAAGRTVYVVGDVDFRMVHSVVTKLEELDASDGDIRVVLSSDGGDEDCGYAIHDALSMCRNRVVAEVFGGAFSIAAIILQAADRRLMAPNARFMIHNGAVAIEHDDGKVQQDYLIENAERIKKDNQRYYSILSIASQHPPETIEAWCRDETYFDAQEAVDAGFADEVMKAAKKPGKPRKARKR